MNKPRQLKHTAIFPIGLGCMDMSECYGKTDDKQSINTIHYALDHGINLFDTADMYGFGANERLLAKALGKRRQEILLATKFGIVRNKNDPTYRGVNGHPDYVRSCIDQSLQRLKTDTIDLYYQHRVDPTIPIEETVGALSECVAQGKVRYIGLSEASATTLCKANAVHPIAAIQTEYSMTSREVESNGVLQKAKDLNVAFIAYSPLCRALLSSWFSLDSLEEHDIRKQLPRFTQQNIEHNRKALLQLEQIALDHNLSLAQLSLAWLLAQGDHIIPIPGTRRIAYLKENIAAAQVTLNSATLTDINKVLETLQLKGGRYTEDATKAFNLNG